MGFPYPGGEILHRESQKANPKAFHLPHPKVDGSPYDFSFSGLKTAVINLLHNAQQKGETERTGPCCQLSGDGGPDSLRPVFAGGKGSGI